MIQNNLCMEIPIPDHYIDTILYSDGISTFMRSLSRTSILLDKSIGNYDFKLHVSPDKYLYMYNSLTDYNKNIIKLHDDIKMFRVLEVSPVNIGSLDSPDVGSFLITIRVMQIWKI